ncbi:unnamed protein product [Arctogadus glacialis]
MGAEAAATASLFGDSVDYQCVTCSEKQKEQHSRCRREYSHPAHLHMLVYEAHPIPAISLPHTLYVPCGGPRETLLHGRGLWSSTVPPCHRAGASRGPEPGLRSLEPELMCGPPPPA